MNQNDSVLTLLQDIKDMLFGIMLLLCGGFLCLLFTMLEAGWLLQLVSVVPLSIEGLYRTIDAWRHCKVAKLDDETGGSHVL